MVSRSVWRRRMWWLIVCTAGCVFVFVLVDRPRRQAGLTGGIGHMRVGNSTLNAEELVAHAEASVTHTTANAASLEEAAILSSRSARQVSQRKTRKKKLLCAVFSNADRSSVQTILANMEHMTASCDWALIFYGGDESLIRLLQHAIHGKEGITIVKCVMAEPREQLLSKFHVNLNLLASASAFHQTPAWQEGKEGRKGHIPEKHNSLVYPKSLQYMYLLELLPSYERVWLLDSDISTVGFNVREFLKATDCAFSERPLVAQPLIAESTQSYKYLNANAWKGTAIIATSTDFVEIQAPLLDSDFFDWFLRFFIVPLLTPSHILGADWGFDALFCNAARIFAHHNGRGESKHVCMIVTAGTPLHHLDRAALDETLGYELKKYLNKALVAIIQSAYPHVYHSGHDKSINPALLPAHYLQVTSFQNHNHNCIS